jgi:hypothetical protein
LESGAARMLPRIATMMSLRVAVFIVVRVEVVGCYRFTSRNYFNPE